MVLLFTEKKIYQKELMIIMKQIKKINLKSQVRAELETGRRIAWDKVEIDTILSDDILPRGMKVKGFPERKPFLFLSSVNYDEKNRESVYIREYINTSILKYSQIRKRIF